MNAKQQNLDVDYGGFLNICRIIGKRPQWLLSGALLGLAAAASFILLTKPVYTSYATVQVGKVHEIGLIEDMDALTIRLMEQHGNRQMPYLKQAARASLIPGRPNKTATNTLLRLTAVGHSPEEAQDFLTGVVTALIQRHQQVYETAVNPLRLRIAALDNQRRETADQIAKLKTLLRVGLAQRPVEASLSMIELGRLRAELHEMDRERPVFKQQAENPYSVPSEVVVGPVLVSEPIAPRKLITLVVGVVVGLAMGLMAALFREFYANLPFKNVTFGVNAFSRSGRIQVD